MLHTCELHPRDSRPQTVAISPALGTANLYCSSQSSQLARSVYLKAAGPQCGNLLSGKLDILCSEGETPSKTESLAEYIRTKLSTCYPA